jgi:glucosylceramidase
MKHVSHYVKPGAVRLQPEGRFNDLLTFVNPDNSIVVIAGNDEATEQTVSMRINGTVYSPTLKPHSLNTLIVRAEE